MNHPVTITVGGFAERAIGSFNELSDLGYRAEAVIFHRVDDGKRQVLRPDGSLVPYMQAVEESHAMNATEKP